MGSFFISQKRLEDSVNFKKIWYSKAILYIRGSLGDAEGYWMALDVFYCRYDDYVTGHYNVD